MLYLIHEGITTNLKKIFFKMKDESLIYIVVKVTVEGRDYCNCFYLTALPTL